MSIIQFSTHLLLEFHRFENLKSLGSLIDYQLLDVTNLKIIQFPLILPLEGILF